MAVTTHETFSPNFNFVFVEILGYDTSYFNFGSTFLRDRINLPSLTNLT